MFRRWAIAGCVVCGGGAFAQPWPAVPVTRSDAKADAEAVYVMRTAGQSDRNIKVVRAADPSDPASLAEVIDTATKKTFVIPGRVLAKLPKAGTLSTPAAIPPAPVEAPPPVTARVQSSPVAPAPPAVEKPLPKVQLPTVEPKAVTPITLPPAPVEVVKAEVAAPLPQPVRVAPPKPAELPTVASPVTPTAPASPLQPHDPWRATGEAKAVAPTPPPPVAGPRLTPVPTWRATPKPTPPGVSDPWRPSGS